MLTIDDIVKLLLAVSISFAIVVIAFQLMRLFGAVTSSIHDARQILQNVGLVSDMVVEDYNKIRKVIGIITNFRAEVFQPLLSAWQTLTRRGRKKAAEADLEDSLDIE